MSLDTFREEVRAVLEAEAPQSLRGAYEHPFSGCWGGKKDREDEPADVTRWLHVMAERGWTAPTWPKEYGGAGLSKAQAAVLKQEQLRLGLPAPLIGFGLMMIGPTLLEFGSEAQKREHLPRIARGEIRWCQGYSEPDAGSDLASLMTRAERDGDHFIVNGQKVWTSYADKSDWMFCLVRTDFDVRKQAGISFLLFDMESPGVAVRPISLISGSSPFCEVFFENVRARADNLVHDLNAGWTVAKALLQHERTMIGEVFALSVAGGEDQLVTLAREQLGAPDGPIPDALLRDGIVQAAMDEQCFLMTMRRVAAQMKAGGRAGPESSVLKIAGTELNQRRHELAVRIAGPQALGWAGEGFTEAELTSTREWLRSRGNTIEGGTSEIQLNIIAKHALQLPD